MIHYLYGVTLILIVSSNVFEGHSSGVYDISYDISPDNEKFISKSFGEEKSWDVKSKQEINISSEFHLQENQQIT
ncbi:hypothetical protein HK096_009752, partial [Nowakowskiella sp. JEL0078]